MPNVSRSKRILEEMIRLYEDDGLTLKQIGDRFGVTKQAVHERLVHPGVEMLPRSIPPIVVDRDLLYGLYVTDVRTLAETAAKLGVSPNAVVNALKRHGIAQQPMRWHSQSRRTSEP